MTEDIKQLLLSCFLKADRTTPGILLDEYASRFSYQKAVTDVLEPALQLFGNEWMKRGDISLAHAFISGKIAEDLLTKAALERQQNSSYSETKGNIVLGNIEGDYHSLGRRIISSFLKASSWQVFDLGNDVLAEEFVDKALEINAPVIGISAMMYSNAMNIKKVREEIDRRNLTGKIQLAVGGAVFNMRPELVQEVGGDGTAPNAFSSIHLFENLFEKVHSAGI